MKAFFSLFLFVLVGGSVQAADETVESAPQVRSENRRKLRTTIQSVSDGEQEYFRHREMKFFRIFHHDNDDDAPVPVSKKTKGKGGKGDSGRYDSKAAKSKKSRSMKGDDPAPGDGAQRHWPNRGQGFGHRN